MGAARFPRAERLLITAARGGSNSSRARLWKVALQQLADDIGLALTVSHFPRGTSKWNKVEYRLFSFITNNRRGKPLVSHQAIGSLIAGTTTTKGLIVKAALDENTYDTGIAATNEQMANLKPTRAMGHPKKSATQHRKNMPRSRLGFWAMRSSFVWAKTFNSSLLFA